MLITIVQHSHNFIEYNSAIIDQYDLDEWLNIDEPNSSGLIDLFSIFVLLDFLIAKSFDFTKKVNEIAHGINITTCA